MEQIKKYKGRATGFLSEFKDFAMKGNVIDLAVGVVIGTAFNGIVDSFVKDIIMQAIAGIFKKPDFASFVISYNDVVYMNIGNFINQIINFLIVGLSVFVAIKAINKLSRNRAAEEAKEGQLAV